MEPTPEEKEKIKQEIDKLKSQYPNRYPLYIISDDFDLYKNKFIVPGDLTFGQLQHVLRKKIKTENDKPVLNEHEAMYCFINQNLVPCQKIISQIYKEFADQETGQLTVMICKENTFGKN